MFRYAQSRNLVIAGCALACLVLAGALWCPMAVGQTMSVGVAKVDITPETPVRMYGYASRTEESTSVAGRLHATAVAIGSDDGEGPAVFLSVDSGTTPRPIRNEVLQRVAKRHPLRSARFVLCNSHTHAGPNLKGMASMSGSQLEHMTKYAEQVTDRLEQVVLDALKARAPGHLEWAQGSGDVAANRRVLKDGKWTGFGVTPEGPVDHSVPVIRVRAENGKTRAVIANYACHCTTLGPKNMQIHGDWAGAAQSAFETEHPGVPLLISIGCGADSNPNPRGTMELCEQHGRAFATEVSRLLSDGKWTTLPAQLMAEERILRLAYEKPAGVDQGEIEVVEPATEGGAPAREEHSEETFFITTWAFGDALALVFLSDEVVVDYALRLKRELDADRLWVSAYTNDVSRYIVSRRLIQEEGYEVRNSLSQQLTFGHADQFDPPMEDRITKAVRAMLPESYVAP